MKFKLAIFFENLYHRANLPPSRRQITRFALELERFVHYRATTIENEKLRSEGVVMYAYIVSVYWVEPFEKNAKVKLVANFVVDNESRFFFDA